jgi:adenylate cyclase
MARQFWVLDNDRYDEIVVRICNRVVEIDPNYAQAWATMALGQWNMFWRGDSGDDGERAAGIALRLDPNLADSHSAMGAAHRSKGRFEQGLAACRKALHLEPNSYVGNRIAGLCCLGLRRYDDAIGHFEVSAAAMESDFTASSFISQCYKAKGDTERMRSAARKSLDRIEKIVAAEPGHGRAIGLGVNMLAFLEEKERAKEWATRARLVEPENVNLQYNLACAMSSLGEIDVTLETLTAIAPRLTSGMMSWMETDTDFDPIREDPGFRALMESLQARFAKS